MDAASVSSTTLYPAGPVQPAGRSGAVGTSHSPGNFQRLLVDQLQAVSEQHQESDAQIQQLISGQTDQVHNVILAVAQAELGFRFLIELRNRLTESYQELMRMQV